MNVNLQVNRRHSQLLLGITLRYARLKAGLSLRDLSDLANVSHTLIANIEKGKIIANAATLKDLFTILKIDFRDDQKLIDEFVIIYNRTFHNLYMDHINRTVDDIRYLESKEEYYLNSIVLIDYSLLRFLHAALTNKMTPYLRDNLDLLYRVGTLLSMEQQQIRHLIFGIDYYNRGLFKQGYEELVKARTIGHVNLDPLINVFAIKCKVHMFRFMDAQQLADRTINDLEDDLNYLRAMDVRLSLAHSHILLHKFDDVNFYLHKVCHYGHEFDEQALLNRCLSFRAISFLLQGKYNEVIPMIEQMKGESALSIYVEMMMAAHNHNNKEVLRLYNHVVNDVLLPHEVRERLFYDVMIRQLRAIECSETEFIEKLEVLIQHGTMAHDQELLMYGYDILIEYYKDKRYYKKALELSEEARRIRSFGKFSG